MLDLQPSSTNATDVRMMLVDDGTSRIDWIGSNKPAELLVVTFPAADDVATGEVVFGELEFGAAGFDVLAVRRLDAGFAPEDLAAVLDGLPPYRKIVAIGIGQAGYETLRLCGPIDRLTLLLLAPRPLADTPTPAVAQTRADIVALYDLAIATQRRHAEVLKLLFPSARVVGLHHVGEQVHYGVLQVDLLISTVKKVAEGDDATIRADFRQRRRRAPSYLFNLGRRAEMGRHFKAARNLYKLALKLSDDINVLMGYSRALAGSAQYDAAIAALVPLTDVPVPNPHVIAMRSYYEELAGRDEAALASIRRAMALEPGFQPFSVNEHRILERLYRDASMKLGMSQAVLLKMRAEAELEHGDRAKPGKGTIGLFLLASILIAAAVFLVGRWADLL